MHYRKRENNLKNECLLRLATKRYPWKIDILFIVFFINKLSFYVVQPSHVNRTIQPFYAVMRKLPRRSQPLSAV